MIQTAMAANSEESARRVPLIAAIPKMFFPFLVILPGLIAIGTPMVTRHVMGQAAAGRHDRDHQRLGESERRAAA